MHDGEELHYFYLLIIISIIIISDEISIKLTIESIKAVEGNTAVPPGT